MTVGVVNNWNTLNVTGTISPEAVSTGALTVGGTPVSTFNPTPVANIPDAAEGTEIATINAILAALVELGLMDAE